MVMPDTGFLAVVAIALAATEVKKKEKTMIISEPMLTVSQETGRWPRKAATPIALMMTPMKI
jgi:hypothetical protein